MTDEFIDYDSLTDFDLNCAVAEELGWKPSGRKSWAWLMPGSDYEMDITDESWADTVVSALGLNFAPYSLEITKRPDDTFIVTALTESDMLAEMAGDDLARLISVQWLNLRRLMR